MLSQSLLCFLGKLQKRCEAGPGLSCDGVEGLVGATAQLFLSLGHLAFQGEPFSAEQDEVVQIRGILADLDEV